MRTTHSKQHSYLLQFIAISALSMAMLISACTKDEFITDGDAKLVFSLDTISFDTVFTQRGSATLSLKLYNRHNRFIKVSRIWLEGAPQSAFRMNVDGIAGSDISDVEIPPDDSIYVFFEVTVDPDQPISISPFVIEDQANFMTNGNAQSVVLEAWGQNANYLPGRFFGGRQSLFTCDLNEWVWDDPKPYVIFGAMVIDSCTLVMPPGTQVYIHGGIGRTEDRSPYSDGILYFFRHGKLQIQGSFDDPVVIQGDRLESSFGEVPGQWGRIQLGPMSTGHNINHAVIKNGILGLLVDSLADLTIRNSQISNASGTNLAGYNASILAENCLFHTSGGTNVSLILGGDYDFSYCTLANYGSPTEALRASNFTCLDGTALCERPVAAPLNMSFRNSIIYGSSRDEIALVDGVGEQDPRFFRYEFKHCVVRVDELVSEEGGHPDFFDFCDPCINGDFQSLLFADPDMNDYHLDSLSIAQEIAQPVATLRRDLEGNERDPTAPDAGCFEYQD
ncbi:MAG: hypothetical protein HKN87_04955 [Saprospiraceae bacterium]|nr:hypothetical protein [Saprospiraceae bacterium]